MSDDSKVQCSASHSENDFDGWCLYVDFLYGLHVAGPFDLFLEGMCSS